jgi:hypothetical protein
MKLTTGKRVDAVFCPKCNDLVYYDADVFTPTEVYCPEHDALVAIPPRGGSSAKFYVSTVSSDTITIECDGKPVKFT